MVSGGRTGGDSRMLVGYGEGMKRLCFCCGRGMMMGGEAPFLWEEGGWEEMGFMGEGAMVICWGR